MILELGVPDQTCAARTGKIGGTPRAGAESGRHNTITINPIFCEDGIFLV
jgi:hypothetical protein